MTAHRFRKLPVPKRCGPFPPVERGAAAPVLPDAPAAGGTAATAAAEVANAAVATAAPATAAVDTATTVDAGHKGTGAAEGVAVAVETTTAAAAGEKAAAATTVQVWAEAADEEDGAPILKPLPPVPLKCQPWRGGAFPHPHPHPHQQHQGHPRQVAHLTSWTLLSYNISFLQRGLPIYDEVGLLHQQSRNPSV